MTSLTPTRLRTALALALLAWSSTGCSSLPGLQDPEITLSPRFYLYDLTGDARMQSFAPSGVAENAAVSTSQLGQNRRGDDVGGVLAIGDGFSGIEFEYQRIELEDTSTGVLSADFGAVPPATTVSSTFTMDELRLSYTVQLLDHEFDLGEEQYLRVRLGPSATLVHREGGLFVFEDGNSALNQDADFSDDGVPYVGLRGRVDWNDVALQVDWDYNPDLTFGGDFDGELHDLEVLARYEFDAQDISVLAGYRWSDLRTSGSAGDLRYDMDFQLEGWVLALEFTF